MRHYTLNNAHEKILHRHCVIKSGGFVSSDVSLHHLYNRLSSGQTIIDIKKDLPEIPKSRLLLARAFFAASDPDAYKNRKVTGLKVLVDENVDEHFVTDAAGRAFGHASHVAFEGLADDKDIKLWKHAVKQGYDFIITKDKATVAHRKTLDLTLCAEKTWGYRLRSNGGRIGKSIEKLPRVVHIMDGSLGSIEVSKLLVDHRDNIVELFEECSSPIIQVHKNSVKPGKHFLELIKKGQFEKIRVQRDAVVAQIVEEYGLYDVRGQRYDLNMMDPQLRVEEKEKQKKQASMMTYAKRIAEHEMAEQLALSNGHLLSNIALMKKVRRVLSPAFNQSARDVSQVLRGIVNDYKGRGVTSVMADENRALVIV